MTLQNKDPRVTTALVLAAGAGRRLFEWTRGAPKWLTRVNGISILEHQVACLERWGFERLVVVVGHEAEQIKAAVLLSKCGLEVEYVMNPLHKTTNNVYSLWAAREVVREGFLLMECDLFFEPGLLEGMLHPDRMAVARLKPWMQGTTVTLDASRNVTAFEIGGSAGHDPSLHKTVNLYTLSSDTWRRVTARLESHISSGQVNDYYEVVFRDMVADGTLDFQAVAFDDGRWYEIDTIEDLRAAEMLFARTGTSSVSTPMSRSRSD